MKAIVTLTSVLIFFSCKNDGSVTANLTNGSFKYWTSEVVARNENSVSTYFYFDSKGKWLVFRKDVTGVFAILDRGDVEFYETWSLVNDSTIDIGSRAYLIRNLTNESATLVDIITKDTIDLLETDLKEVPEKFRTFQ